MATLPDSQARPATRTGWTRLDLIALVAVLALGLAALPQPLAWDQTMFALGARKMHHGAVLYRDYWDPKQPALFFFYELAGMLFGFDAPGFHALELVLLLAFAVVLLRTLSGRYERRWIASLAPLLTVGYYYAVATDGHLTQIEALAGFPLYLCLWWALRGAARREGGALLFAASGAAGAAALALKILFAPLLAAFWLVALVRLARGPSGAKVAAAAVGAIAAGFGAALLPLVAYFAFHHAGSVAWWTTFVYPGEALAEIHTVRIHYLTQGLTWFLTTWAVPLALAVVGLGALSRRGPDPLGFSLGLWLAVGFFVLMIQSLSYWPYQYLLLSVPVGLLAAEGLDALSPRLERIAARHGRFAARAAGTLTLALLFAVPIAHATIKTAALARHRFALSAGDRQAFQCGASRDSCMSRIREDTAFLDRPQARPGALFVLGNPMTYWISGRDQAVPRNGASFIEYASADEWTRLASSLAAARPAYVFVAEMYLPMIARSRGKCAPFIEWLASDYRLLRRSREGFWFERAEARPAH